MSEKMNGFAQMPSPATGRTEETSFVWDCPICGKMMLRDARACSRCGYAPVLPNGGVHTRPFGRRRVCPVCGTHVSDGSENCWHCGVRFVH